MNCKMWADGSRKTDWDPTLRQGQRRARENPTRLRKGSKHEGPRKSKGGRAPAYWFSCFGGLGNRNLRDGRFGSSWSAGFLGWATPTASERRAIIASASFR